MLMPENKSGRLQYSKAQLKICRNCDPKHLDKIVTDDQTWIYTSEEISKQSMGTKRWESSNCSSMPLFKEGSLHDFLQLKRNSAAKTVQTRRDNHWKVLQGFSASWGQEIWHEGATKHKNGEGGGGGLHVCITHLLTNCILCRSILQRRTLKLFHTLHTGLILLPVTVPYSHIWRNASREEFQVPVSPWNCCFPGSGTYTLGGLLISISTMDWVTREVCDGRGGIVWKAEVENFPGWWVCYA